MRTILAVVAACWLTSGCATFSSYTLDSSLQLQETNQLIPNRVARMKTDRLGKYLPALRATVQARGIDILTVKDLSAVLAEFSPAAFTASDEIWGFNTMHDLIMLDDSLSVDETFYTLVHELGHSLQPEGISGEDGQVFAESLSVIVCQRLGLDVTRTAFPYFQLFDSRHAVMQKHGRLLDKFATEIVAAVRK